MRRLMDESTKDDQRAQERIALASAFSWRGSAEIVTKAYELTAESMA
jgi:alpha-1,3-rhamnosyl/mannosyltransferase